jgi:glutaminyl-tRNA synthetase
VELLNYPEDGEEWFEAPLHPKDPEGASRRIPFGRHLLIESDDFEEIPPKKYKRLSPGAEVRLRHGYVIRCERFDADAAGRPTKLYCTVDLESRAGGANAEKKVKGVIHWVSATHALDAEVRLYDRLFTDPDPSGIKTEGGFRDVLNPESLERCAAKLEPALGSLAPGEVVQFERLGYFCPDPDSTDTARRFNRTITLRDTWGGK